MILRVYSAEIIGLTFVPALLGVRTIGASRKVVAKIKQKVVNITGATLFSLVRDANKGCVHDWKSRAGLLGQ